MDTFQTMTSGQDNSDTRQGNPFTTWLSDRVLAGEIERGSGPADHGLTKLYLSSRAARRIILGLDAGGPFIGFQPLDFDGLSCLPLDCVLATNDSLVLQATFPGPIGLQISVPSMAIRQWAPKAIAAGLVEIAMFELVDGKPRRSAMEAKRVNFRR